MKNYKMFLRFFFILILAISAALFSGCAKKPVESSTSSGDGAFSYNDYIEDNGFWNGIKALDYVEIFNYKAMPVPKDIHHVSDDTIQSEISNLLANYTSATQITDRAVADGDLVNIDYVGSVDGVEFDGGSTGGMGTDVTAGSTGYIDDFLTQIIGHMPGETINVEVTFPVDYHSVDLQGKDALFVTTINYINGEPVEPELTDDFVMSNFSANYNWKTVEEMKENMKSDLQKSAVEQYIRQYFTTEVKVKSVPDLLIDYQNNSMINYYQEYATMYGMELNDFLNSYVGFPGVDELIANYQENNLKEATYLLVVQAVAEDMNFSVSEKDLADYFLKYVGSSDYSQYVDQYGLSYINHVVLNEKILDYIIANAVLE